MNGPSVIARPLLVAERLLADAGVAAVEVQRTEPPRGGPAGPLRVIRQRETADGIELVVAPSVPLLNREEAHD